MVINSNDLIKLVLMNHKSWLLFTNKKILELKLEKTILWFFSSRIVNISRNQLDSSSTGDYDLFKVLAKFDDSSVNITWLSSGTTFFFEKRQKCRKNADLALLTYFIVLGVPNRACRFRICKKIPKCGNGSFDSKIMVNIVKLQKNAGDPTKSDAVIHFPMKNPILIGFISVYLYYW